MIFSANINNELLAEFIEQIEENQQTIDILTNRLELFPNNLSLLNELRDHFTELMYSSVKLDLTPISESLADTIIALDLLVQFKIYPGRMSEFLSLIVDKLLLLTRDIEHQQGIDVCKSQHILVALQHVILIKDPELLEAGVYKAITSMLHTVIDTDSTTGDDTNSDIVLFDDDNSQPVQKEYVTNKKSDNFDVFVPEKSHNPIFQAREATEMFLANHPINLLVSIADRVEPEHVSHTRYLLEMGLAINTVAGDVVDPENLMLGISIHDLALASTPEIINKTSSLSKTEIEKVQQHPTIAYEFANFMNLPSEASELVLHHHERIDGQGYPWGIKGKQICEGAKLLSIIDAFHCMTESRPYRRFPKSILRSVAEINAGVNTQFDDQWVSIFNNFIKNHWLPMRQAIAC